MHKLFITKVITMNLHIIHYTSSVLSCSVTASFHMFSSDEPTSSAVSGAVLYQKPMAPPPEQRRARNNDNKTQKHSKLPTQC